MPFHCVYQIGQNGFQPLSAYPVPGFPDDDKSFSNSLIVDTAPISLPGAAATCLPPKQTNRVLSMEPRQLAELIQYLELPPFVWTDKRGIEGALQPAPSGTSLDAERPE